MLVNPLRQACASETLPKNDNNTTINAQNSSSTFTHHTIPRAGMQEKAEQEVPVKKSPSPWLAAAWRMHFYIGIFIAPFIFVAAVTGVIYGCVTMLVPYVYAHNLHVDPIGKPHTFHEQVLAATQAHPDWKFVQLYVNDPTDATSNTTWVIMEDSAGNDHAVFVDPYHATVLGQMGYGNDFLGPVDYFDTFHRMLQLGNTGRMYSELAASWMWIIAITGTLLWGYRWWNNKKQSSHSTTSRSSSANTSKNSPRIWHARLGLIALLGLFFLSVTGITWSHYAGDNVAAVRSSLGWTKPSLDVPASSLAEGNVSTDYDGMVDSAHRAQMREPFVMYVPSHADKPIEVHELSKDYRMGRGIAALDPVTLEVKQSNPFSTYPLMAKITDWLVRIHMGNLLGIGNKLVLIALGLVIIATIVLAYWMWWKRRPKLLPVSFFALVKGLPLWGHIMIVVVAIGLGWFLPLLGVSLIVFALIDAGLRALAYSRTHAHA